MKKKIALLLAALCVFSVLFTGCKSDLEKEQERKAELEEKTAEAQREAEEAKEKYYRFKKDIAEYDYLQGIIKSAK